jgi:hypothetical protein
MSRRDRVTLVLGILVAIGLVVYPLAFRLSREWGVPAASASAGLPISESSDQPVAGVATATSPAQPSSSVPTGGPTDPSWLAAAQLHRGSTAVVFKYECSPNGTAGPLWGTDVYTDDSSVCTAGVHKGVITLEAGGTVRIVMRPGLDVYISSTRNGVKSDAWDHWDGSYAFVEP